MWAFLTAALAAVVAFGGAALWIVSSRGSAERQLQQTSRDFAHARRRCRDQIASVRDALDSYEAEAAPVGHREQLLIQEVRMLLLDRCPYDSDG